MDRGGGWHGTYEKDSPLIATSSKKLKRKLKCAGESASQHIVYDCTGGVAIQHNHMQTSAHYGITSAVKASNIKNVSNMR